MMLLILHSCASRWYVAIIIFFGAYERSMIGGFMLIDKPVPRY
jgi:hypothetical protein